MVPASSAYDRAENSAVTAAKTNETVTAGPATGTAAPRMTKMPVPRVAPTLNMVSWVNPMVRLRSPPSPCPPSATISSVGLVRKICLSTKCAFEGPVAAWRHDGPGVAVQDVEGLVQPADGGHV